MSIRRILVRNISAGAWARVTGALVKLLQVPLLLSALGVDDFGRWLVIFTLPSWLMIANMGFGSVAANDMSMANATGDSPRARTIFSSTVALVIFIGVVGVIATGTLCLKIPWDRIFGVFATRRNEFAAAVFWLSSSSFLSFYVELFEARFRAGRKAHLGVFLWSFRPWIELLAIVIALQFGSRLDYLSFAIFGSTIVFCCIYQWTSRYFVPEIFFSFANIKFDQFKHLFQKGLAFQAFPLGNAFLFQGNLLIVQILLGPAAVAVFGTTRTLVRTVNQIMEVLNQAIWPEMSHLMGANQLDHVRRLHRLAVALSVVAACSGTLFLAAWGQRLYGIWVGDAIELPLHVLWLFLLPIPFNALWFTSSVVHSASNKHEGLAVRYILATVLSSVACILLSLYFGVEGAAASTLVADLVLIPYVLRQSLVLTGDNWKNFAAGSLNELAALPKLVRKRVWT